MSGNFYVCATPIGNMGDITYRAVEVLSKIDCIACEDTRVTRQLTQKYGINAKLIDCHKFNEKEKSKKILQLLSQGLDVALVSDAGTPLISDPGCVLIDELIKNNIKITALPGACSLTTFLSLIPRSNEEFAFIGFIPRTKDKQIELLNKYKFTNCVFFESPLRLLKTLQNILDEFGSNIKISVARELTKMFEEIQTGYISDVINYFNTNTLKGEIIVMIYSQEQNTSSDNDLLAKIDLLKKEGYSTKDISKILSVLFNENKNKIYELTEKRGNLSL